MLHRLYTHKPRVDIKVAVRQHTLNTAQKRAMPAALWYDTRKPVAGHNDGSVIAAPGMMQVSGSEMNADII